MLMSYHYAAYMLRLWQVGEGERAPWRASLEDPHTGELLAFASMESFLTYIKALTCQGKAGADDACDVGVSPALEGA
jgi:hypothetical protein